MIIDDRVVRLNWVPGRDTDTQWNEICVSAIEEFGLPGNKFTWKPTEEYMDFIFVDPRDALLFQLRWL
jgi:hypothetical protein